MLKQKQNAEDSPLSPGWFSLQTNGEPVSDKAQGTSSSLVRAEIKEGEQVNLQGTSKESGRKQDMSSGILRLSVWSAHWASAQGLH